MTNSYKEHEIIIHENDLLNQFALILEGTVQVNTPFGTFELIKGMSLVC